jgi:hypothetical protein
VSSLAANNRRVLFGSGPHPLATNQRVVGLAIYPEANALLQTQSGKAGGVISQFQALLPTLSLAPTPQRHKSLMTIPVGKTFNYHMMGLLSKHHPTHLAPKVVLENLTFRVTPCGTESNSSYQINGTQPRILFL